MTRVDLTITGHYFNDGFFFNDDPESVRTGGLLPDSPAAGPPSTPADGNVVDPDCSVSEHYPVGHYAIRKKLRRQKALEDSGVGSCFSFCFGTLAERKRKEAGQTFFPARALCNAAEEK